MPLCGLFANGPSPPSPICRALSQIVFWQSAKRPKLGSQWRIPMTTGGQRTRGESWQCWGGRNIFMDTHVGTLNLQRLYASYSANRSNFQWGLRSPFQSTDERPVEPQVPSADTDAVAVHILHAIIGAGTCMHTDTRAMAIPATSPATSTRHSTRQPTTSICINESREVANIYIYVDGPM